MKDDICWDADAWIATWRNAVNIIDVAIGPYILPHIDIKKGGRVLECGVGSGKWSAAFALLGYRVYAMDNSRAILQRVSDNFPNINFKCIEKDIRDSPLIDPPVDLIFNEGVIEHFLDDAVRKKVLTNFYEAVKGYVAIVVPYKSEEENELFYTQKRLKEELEEVGFHVFNQYCLSFLSGDRETMRRMIGAIARKNEP